MGVQHGAATHLATVTVCRAAVKRMVVETLVSQVLSSIHSNMATGTVWPPTWAPLPWVLDFPLIIFG